MQSRLLSIVSLCCSYVPKVIYNQYDDELSYSIQMITRINLIRRIKKTQVERDKQRANN
jgi:hypothetical protein